MMSLRVLLVASLAVVGCHREQTAPSSAPAAPATASTPKVEEADGTPEFAAYIAAHYDKREVRIPMRDGVELFTTIYTPQDAGQPKPIMMMRTPYGVGPYGKDALPNRLGPSENLARRDWIFVYQDVRGRFMSGGTFVNMTPHVTDKQQTSQTDESTDTHDTITWLLEHVPGNNGRVGQWGISYPGFYAAAGMIDHHPALVAVSPQAPIADWYFDDFHHHGAFFLPHAFNFLATFGQARPEPTTEWPKRFEHGTPDGYAFFLDLGPLENANVRHLQSKIEFWNDIVAHPDYDGFWKARNLLPHLHDVAPAVMTVGGWFDAEDLYGPLHIYRAIEDANPDVFNVLVMGPWQHGGWSRSDGRRLGAIDFGADNSVFYREHIEAPFFVHHLEGGPAPDLPEVMAFETGANAWRRFDAWPPSDARPRTFYVAEGGRLEDAAPTVARGYDEYVSDPSRPVPFTEAITTSMTKEYMVDDQRFAARRPDVVVYQTEPLEQPLTVAGPIEARLWVSTTGTDADFVVKLIDVFPDDATMPSPPGATTTDPVAVGGYQMMVRSEVFRARYREDYARPRPLAPGVPTEVHVPLQSVLHTFEPGHRVMIQIQSTWFPLVDRNPQKYVPNVFEAHSDDFIVARHRILRSKRHPTRIELGVLPGS